MNPYLARKLTEQHVRDLHLDAQAARPLVTRHGPRARGRYRSAAHRSVRQRAGWTLVTIGLRLAATADDA
jgi:hypothetical protein